MEEAEKVRSVILADFPGDVEYMPEDEGPFDDRITAEAEAGQGTIGVLGAQHGGFIGNPPMNFLPGRLQGANGRVQLAIGEHTVPAPPALAGRGVVLGIRAENIEAEVTPVPEALVARTEVIEPLGANLLITAVVGDHRLKPLTRNDFPDEVDGSLWLRPEPDKLRWFDPETGPAGVARG